MNLDNKKIVVVGGAGLIGSHTVDKLLNENVKEIIIYDNMTRGSEDNLREALQDNRVKIYDVGGDILQTDILHSAFKKADAVFHFAALWLLQCHEYPRAAFEVNIKGTFNVMEACVDQGIKRLIYSSSASVYGDAEYEPMDESHPLKPTTSYASGKAAADIALFSWVKMFDLDSFIIRPFNNYGPRQNYKGYLAGIIPITAWRICNGLAPEIHGSGDQTRDFIYVKDTIDAVLKLYPLLKPAESINVSTDGQISMNKVIQKIIKFFKYDGEVLKKPSRSSDVMTHNACNKKIKDYIQYNLTDFDEGLEKTLEIYKEMFQK